MPHAILITMIFYKVKHVTNSKQIRLKRKFDVYNEAILIYKPVIIVATAPFKTTRSFGFKKRALAANVAPHRRQKYIIAIN